MVAKVRGLARQRDSGTLPSNGGIPTVEQWLTHWVETIASQRVATRTLDSYRDTVRQQLVPALGRFRLDRLQPEHVEALYARLQQKGRAPSSVLRTHQILSRALKVAVQRGRVGRNVCALVDAPSARRTEVEPLTAAEARAVLATAAEQHNSARWSVALALGLAG